MFDIFFISANKKHPYITELRDRFVFAKHAETVADAQKKSLTKMFWVVWDDLVVSPDFNFDYAVPEWDMQYVHTFKNSDNSYFGISLIPKNKYISNKEVEYRTFLEKKEIDLVATSYRMYDIFSINDYEEYQTALENSVTDLFWMTGKKIKPVTSFKFDLTFSFSDKYNKEENHAFLHSICGTEKYDGIFLLSKSKPVSKREIESRFLVNKKEWNIVASTNKPYDLFQVDTYDDYLYALENATTELFWMVPAEVSINPDFDLDLFFEDRTDQLLYDRTNHHSFKHQFRDELNFNGLNLITKKIPLSEREIKYRFVTNSKKHETIATKLKPYDIIFISYNEPTADENFAELIKLYPRAKRVHGVKGIHQAHIKAAELSETEMFWVVDGDAKIVDTFKFDYQVPVWDYDTVHVWRSINPINNLEYGYGGVKLFPRKETLAMDVTKPDMTTSISDKFKAMPEVSNVTAFNTDPFNTWKSAFRECVKLASRVIDGQKSEETLERLNIWKSEGSTALYGRYALSGAIAGAEYGNANRNSIEALAKINDFSWLKDQFNDRY